MRGIIAFLKYITLLLVLGGMILVGKAPAQAADFNQSNLVEDARFINIAHMDTVAIQRFLESRGSYLKEFSEGGRSAAQIIYDASHGYGDASGSINGITINTSTGTVNPAVILVTLQKEQSLISKTYRDDVALAKAMGYACPDSGSCNPAYAGFTKQVENGAWQFRYNYERAYGYGFADYQVGQDFCFVDWNGTNCGRFDNRATASLYRYTPHVYNGNYNFWNLYFNTYQLHLNEFAHVHVSQSGYATLAPGQAANLWVRVRNTGTATWQKGQVNLATSRPRDRISPFTREGGNPSGWVSANRVQFEESSVAPGATATYSFWIRNDGVSTGTYREHFQLVADGVGWMEDYGIYWDVTSVRELDKYRHSHVSQSGYATLAPGQAANLWVRVRNTGTATWQKGQVNLATSRSRDRISPFTREGGNPSGWVSANRVQFEESSVAPGATATYSFW
ncbi:MAG: hypothetical protein OEV37_00005, partial [Candidatus Berkelbacteria bacterium]|nr:hypothetical protein [Candidatus Berkelbacteria bacterium]